MTGILVPMPEEIELILQNMQVSEVVHIGMRDYYVGSIANKNCVVALSRIGKVASAVTAALMIERFKISALIVTGVAGGLNDEVKIGDLVIATSCVQHDLDCSPLFPKFEAPLLGKSFFECDAKMIQKSHIALQYFIENELHHYIPEENFKSLGIQKPSLHKGLLVSGDQFIGTTMQLNEILKHLPEAYFVEMEGAAVAQVCYENKVPFVVIRSISDKANQNAHIDFNNYIHLISRNYSWALIEQYFKRN